jgi:hypothetical protein
MGGHWQRNNSAACAELQGRMMSAPYKKGIVLRAFAEDPTFSGVPGSSNLRKITRRSLKLPGNSDLPAFSHTWPLLMVCCISSLPVK